MLTLPIVQRPASPSNFSPFRRGLRIDMLVIHVMEGFMKGTGAWFADPSAKVSAHYGIDADGRIEQYVQECDTAWHAGNATVNNRSIGIELEGHISDPNAFTQLMMSSLVQLAKDVCARHQIQKNRAFIIGHNEVPDPRIGHAGQFGGADGHKDPGPFFPWPDFISKLVAP